MGVVEDVIAKEYHQKVDDVGDCLESDVSSEGYEMYEA